MVVFELSTSVDRWPDPVQKFIIMSDGRRLDPVQKLIIMSDDSVITKQIQDTHTPDGREIDCDSLLLIIEEILYRTVPLGIQAAMQENSIPAGFKEGLLEALSYVVNRISSEMTYKCLTSGDAHQMVISLLQLLSSYPWEAKLVLLLVAFVLMYSEFWILIKFQASSKLASKIAILKQVPEVEKLKKQLDGLNNLIMLMLDLAKCIVGFKMLPAPIVDLPELSGALDTIPTAIYWTARGIVFCAVYTTQLTAANYEDPMKLGTLEKELSALADKIRSSNENLQKQLTDCYQIIEEKKEKDDYESLVRLTESAHIDNLEVLRALISGNNDEPPLIAGSTKRTTNLDLLRRKYVLFLISGLFDASPPTDLYVLAQIYNEAKTYSGIRNDFELVWIPMVDSLQIQTEATKRQLQFCQEYVPWYSVRQPSFISKPVKRLIKEKFHYRNRQILVVMDPLGRVVNLNALHMMWIWGTVGFPFEKTKELLLWQEETWRLELLVNGIDVSLLYWIRSERYIILYGGFDLQAISDFTVTARRIIHQLDIPLEMVYVGTSTKSPQELGPLINNIRNQRLSNCWEEEMMWFFWTRVESMLLSKIQVEAKDEQDPVMQELEKLLMYDRMGTWALFSKGSEVMLTGRVPALIHLLQKFDEWKGNVGHSDFLIELKEQYNRLPAADDHPCCQLEFDHTTGKTPVSMICPECHRSMEELAVFTCCHDH